MFSPFSGQVVDKAFNSPSAERQEEKKENDQSQKHEAKVLMICFQFEGLWIPIKTKQSIKNPCSFPSLQQPKTVASIATIKKSGGIGSWVGGLPPSPTKISTALVVQNYYKI